MGARLVRDRIGDLPWRYGDAKAALRPVRDMDEHIDLLHRKLLEEAGELMYATSREEMAGEAADLIEAITALCTLRGVDIEQVERVRLAKYSQRGGFDRGTVWDL